MPSILFRSVRVFDGHSDGLTEQQDVLVEDNMISAIGADLSADDAEVVEGAGRTLMPGLIDNHVHLVLNGSGLSQMENTMTWEDLAYGATASATLYLHEGFTTVRDMGGTNGGLQRAIDSGTIEGPRVYPSAAFIGGRGGHADFAPGLARLDMIKFLQAAQTISVHHGALASLLGINALRLRHACPHRGTVGPQDDGPHPDNNPGRGPSAAHLAADHCRSGVPGCSTLPPCVLARRRHLGGRRGR